VQANIINDLLDIETLRGQSSAAKLSRMDVDAAVLSVVRMFTNSVRNKVSFESLTRHCDSTLLLHYTTVAADDISSCR
jgi:hypothetical protein